MAAERATLERELGARQAEAEKRIQAAKSDALSEVRNVAAEAASEIVRRLIGTAPSQAEVASAMAETRKE
jgi:F-type H+-transporting ATPase subunit b